MDKTLLLQYKLTYLSLMKYLLAMLYAEKDKVIRLDIRNDIKLAGETYEKTIKRLIGDNLA